MSVYQWSTGPGTRIEPDAGEKVSGFVPSTPAAAKKLNDILYELTTFAIDYQTKFAVQHDPATGFHTNITATDLVVTSGDFQVTAGGAITAASLALSGAFSGVTATLSGAFSGTTMTLSGDATIDDLTVDEVNFKSPYQQIVTYHHVSQPTTNGSSSFEDGATGIGPGFNFDNMRKIKIASAGDAIIPIEITATKDLDQILLYVIATNSYDIDWELFFWDLTSDGWTTTGESGSWIDGAVAPGGQLALLFANIPDSSPDVAGHGRHVSSNTIFGLKITSNDPDPIFITNYRLTVWASTLANAIR